jgi:hypothetical protein
MSVKRPARAIRGVELQRAEPVRLADAPAQRLGLDLQNPEIGRLRVAEFIGLVAAFQNEAARIAAHILAALGKEDFGARRNGDEEMLVALGLEVMRQALVLQRLGGEARQRDIAQRPQRQIAGEAFGIAELQVEREIGLGDRIVPVAAAVLRGRLGSGDRRLHRKLRPVAQA